MFSQSQELPRIMPLMGDVDADLRELTRLCRRSFPQSDDWTPLVASKSRPLLTAVSRATLTCQWISPPYIIPPLGDINNKIMPSNNRKKDRALTLERISDIKVYA